MIACMALLVPFICKISRFLGSAVEPRYLELSKICNNPDRANCRPFVWVSSGSPNWAEQSIFTASGWWSETIWIRLSGIIEYLMFSHVRSVVYIEHTFRLWSALKVNYPRFFQVVFLLLFLTWTWCYGNFFRFYKFLQKVLPTSLFHICDLVNCKNPV